MVAGVDGMGVIGVEEWIKRRDGCDCRWSGVVMWWCVRGWDGGTVGMGERVQ